MSAREERDALLPEDEERFAALADALRQAASFGTMPGKTWPETLRKHADNVAPAPDPDDVEPVVPSLEGQAFMVAAADAALRARRNTLLLAGHACGHLKTPHGDSCGECREKWPCVPVMRAAGPVLNAVADLPSQQRPAPAPGGGLAARIEALCQETPGAVVSKRDLRAVLDRPGHAAGQGEGPDMCPTCSQHPGDECDGRAFEAAGTAPDDEAGRCVCGNSTHREWNAACPVHGIAPDDEGSTDWHKSRIRIGDELGFDR